MQTATSLPVLLLALPSGVLADLVDRRRVLIGSTVAATLVAVVLTVLTAADRLSSAGLLGLTALLGVTTALTIPAWQAIQPELVPRTELAAAAALNGISMNIARAIGPAAGGLIVAAGGPAWVFGLNAVSFLAVAGVVAGRLRPADPVRREAERLGAAMRAGLSYVRFAPVLRRILLRAGLWALPATALWALLPVVAADRLGLGSGGYGLLLGALGVGARRRCAPPRPGRPAPPAQPADRRLQPALRRRDGGARADPLAGARLRRCCSPPAAAGWRCCPPSTRSPSWCCRAGYGPGRWPRTRSSSSAGRRSAACSGAWSPT